MLRHGKCCRSGLLVLLAKGLSCLLELKVLLLFFCLLALISDLPFEINVLFAESCVEKCEKTGCLNDQCFSSCKIAVNGGISELLQSKCPYDAWIEWDCTSECRYQCMMLREAKRTNNGELPVKYHGKWPFKRVLGLQEPLSVIFSLANLAVHLQSFISFLYLLHRVLPKRPQGKRGPYYEYSFQWTVYGLAALNSWVWSAVFHARSTLVTERADYSAAVALLGIGLIVAIIRTFSLRIEATQVMVAAPVIAFVSTHIMYLNFYNFDYGWNVKVWVTMGVLQVLLWTVWAGYVCHPSRLKLWFVVTGGAMIKFLDILDFPPLGGLLDAHALWHAFHVALTWLWWSFIKDDASHRTSQLLRRTQETGESKKSQ
ncbi:hypothetical protein GOP47_0018665 [Adiantum capillus-veneris]|uniref:Post-GPI attachment to proteins factor 3 n=1 Tax=Adiantum capillus-veneris TaxID=13818 RepID=A0A9D4ZAY1_ADICA|nr:hypothetical protein GOP47_0018665 [Adiantum capillus-veneris]